MGAILIDKAGVGNRFGKDRNKYGLKSLLHKQVFMLRQAQHERKKVKDFNT